MIRSLFFRISCCILILQSTITAHPFFSSVSSSSDDKAEKRLMKKYDYFVSLALLAWMTAEFESYKKVPGAIADYALTDFACKGLTKYTGAKQFKKSVPYVPWMIVSGKKMVKYLVNACKSGAQSKTYLQKRYGKFRWLAYFLAGVFIPATLRAEATKKAFDEFDKKTGLTQVRYPSWIISSTLLTLFAWQFHGAIIDFCDNAIASLYDFFIPSTKVQRYLALRRTLAEQT